MAVQLVRGQVWQSTLTTHSCASQVQCPTRQLIKTGVAERCDIHYNRSISLLRLLFRPNRVSAHYCSRAFGEFVRVHAVCRCRRGIFTFANSISYIVNEKAEDESESALPSST